MKLICLGSSSKGNCYLLDAGDEILMLECGVAIPDVLNAVDYKVNRIIGCLISHEHQDHCGYFEKVLDMQIPIYCSQETSKVLSSCSHKKTTIFHNFKIGNTYRLGNFSFLAFDTIHDAAEPCGFLIHHPQCGNVLFATDTCYLKNRFKGLNNIMLECNYRQDILDKNMRAGNISTIQRKRIVNSHMSYNTCLSTLLANDLSEVNNIVLLHLSDTNSNEMEFQQGIRQATMKNVYVAQSGLIIDNFNKTPF